ncbi:hypothetical protein V8B97DRAFT_1868703 [Scleroderma yunnanense]
MPLSDYIVTDDLTIVLGIIGASVYLLQSLYKPQPLVHPILLGRQSDTGRVRHPGESVVYRNYGTGLMGRFPIRPDKDTNVVNDLVRPQFESPRTLWATKITNAQLNERVAAFGSGITRILSGEPNVLLLLNDGMEFLIADLALAKFAMYSMTLCSPKILPRVLENHPPSAIIVDVNLLPYLLELVPKAWEHDLKIVVVGQREEKTPSKSSREVEIITWSQVEADGAKGSDSTPPPARSPDDAYTVAFFETPTGELRGVRFTHENMTSGVAAIRALLPPSIALSNLDTIISSHSLSTPYGRGIAYTALYENANFATLDSAKMYDVPSQSTKDFQSSARSRDVKDILSAKQYPTPPPTVLFIEPCHLEDLSTSILKDAKASWLFPLAWRHKLAALAEGFISKVSLWDRMVFDNAREHVLKNMADTLKAVVVSGGPISNEPLTLARVAVSVPVINSHTHPCTSGPVFATNALDVQVLPSNERAHVGGPSVNVEVKLKGVNDADVEANGDPVGHLVLRGPSVGRYLVGNGEEKQDEAAWTETGEIARAMTNGAFLVVGHVA